MSVIWNVAFVGAFIAGIAGSASGSAPYVVISVKAQFSDQVKVRDTSHLIKVCLKFSKNCSSVLMKQQFQDFS